MDKAEEVQALHGWKAKEIHRKKASKKKTVATGPAAEFGTIFETTLQGSTRLTSDWNGSGIGGMKAMPLAITLLEAACKISPHRPELWLHLGRLRVVSATVEVGKTVEEVDTSAALEQAIEDLKTALALAKECKGAPPHTEICAQFHLGKHSTFIR